MTLLVPDKHARPTEPEITAQLHAALETRFNEFPTASRRNARTWLRPAARRRNAADTGKRRLRFCKAVVWIRVDGDIVAPVTATHFML